MEAPPSNKVQIDKTAFVANEYPKKIQLVYLPPGLIIQPEMTTHLSPMIRPLEPIIRNTAIHANPSRKYAKINRNCR